MALKYQKSRRENMNFTGNAATSTNGQRQYSRLINGVRSYGVFLHARARVQIAVAAVTNIRNRGSVWALFNEVGIDENGTDRHLYDGRVLRFLSEMHAPSALTATRLTNTAVGTYNLEESAMIWFSHPLSAAPQESVFRELDARQLLQVFANGSTDPVGALVTIGGATVTIDQVSIEVYHIYDARSQELPLFIPTARQIVQAVSAANPQLEINLKTSKFLRALVIQQDTAGFGEVSDILTAYALRGDFRDIVGPQQTLTDADQFLQEFEFGGLVLSNQAYLGLNFQRGGKLSNVVNPSDDVNLRIEANVGVSASGTASRLRIALLELEQVGGLTGPIPFPI